MFKSTNDLKKRKQHQSTTMENTREGFPENPRKCLVIECQTQTLLFLWLARKRSGVSLWLQFNEFFCKYPKQILQLSDNVFAKKNFDA